MIIKKFFSPNLANNDQTKNIVKQEIFHLTQKIGTISGKCKLFEKYQIFYSEILTKKLLWIFSLVHTVNKTLNNIFFYKQLPQDIDGNNWRDFLNEKF